MRFSIAMAVACLLTVGVSAAEPAQAVVRKHTEIASQPLGAALQALAKDREFQIICRADLVADRVAPRVSGDLTPAEALERMLSGTNLTYRYLDDATITIVPVETQSSSGEGDATIRQGSAAGRYDEQPPLRLAQADAVETKPAQGVDEVVVTGKVDFIENDAFGATKMGLAIKETPFSVLPITRDVLDMASIKLSGDLAKLDPSGGSNGRNGGQSKLYSRGFETEVRVDGFRSVYLSVDNDLSPYDRVEVIKGGVSTLYGQSQPGGLVHFVSKLPENTAAARFKAEAGDNSYVRIEGDVTGPLFSSDKWSYRVIAMGQNDDTFRDNNRDDRTSLNASLMYRGDSSSLIIRGRYQEQKVSDNFADGVFQLDGAVPDGMSWQQALGAGEVGLRPIDDVFDDVPRSRSFAPIGAGFESEVKIVQLQHEYSLPTGWKIRSNLQYAKTDIDGTNTFVVGPFDVNGDPIGFEYGADRLATDTTTTAEVNLFGDFTMLGREHTLFFGVDYAERENAQAFQILGFNFGAQNTALNLFNPDYAAAANLITVTPAQVSSFTPVLDSSTYFGATAQVIFKPLDRLSILFGVRYSSDGTSSAGDPDGATYDKRTGVRTARGFDTLNQEVFTHFSKQAGIVYEITDQINAYASAGESYLPSDGARRYVDGNSIGAALAPPLAETYEIGLKGQFAGPFSFALAGFEVTQDAVVEDIEHPTFSTILPGWRSRGVELSFQGRFLESINLYGGIARQNAVYSREPFTGMRGPGAPELGVSLYGTYEMLRGNLRGLGFGAGVVHKSGRKLVLQDVLLDSGDRFGLDVGDYTSVDARVFYNRDRWGVYGSVTNLTDERHVEMGNIPILWFAPMVNAGREFRVGTNFSF